LNVANEDENNVDFQNQNIIKL